VHRGPQSRLIHLLCAVTRGKPRLDSTVHLLRASRTVLYEPGGTPAEILLPRSKSEFYISPKKQGLTWLTTTPLSPTIILLQMISHFTTKPHDSLKNTKKSAKSSIACWSARNEITLAACVLVSSVAEDKMSASSSCIDSGVVAGVTFCGLSELEC
jgi:hypothetical protein